MSLETHGEYMLARVKDLERRERHLKLRIYEAHENALPRSQFPRLAGERQQDMESFLAKLEKELAGCSTCRGCLDTKGGADVE